MCVNCQVGILISYVSSHESPALYQSVKKKKNLTSVLGFNSKTTYIDTVI